MKKAKSATVTSKKAKRRKWQKNKVKVSVVRAGEMRCSSVQAYDHWTSKRTRCKRDEPVGEWCTRVKVNQGRERWKERLVRYCMIVMKNSWWQTETDEPAMQKANLNEIEHVFETRLQTDRSNHRWLNGLDHMDQSMRTEKSRFQAKKRLDNEIRTVVEKGKQKRF